jgi:Choline dehydrogenase and related flavoproteins
MSKTFELKDDSVVVVIGSGAGGGTLSNELTQRGASVVCLEAGPRLTLSDIVNDNATMFGRLSWLDKRIGTGDLNAGLPLWVCKTVGGTTVHWAGASLRFQDHEFRTRTVYGDIPGANLLDWPVTLQELETYYARAEDKMGVTGTHSIPRLPGNNNFKVMAAGAKRLGYKEVHTGNMAINSEDRDGRPACHQIGFCMSGCAIGAKWSTLYTEIPKAESTGRFEIRPESMVVKINHDDRGRVTGVVYADKTGALHEQKARAVCVAGNSVETPRLLLIPSPRNSRMDWQTPLAKWPQLHAAHDRHGLCHHAGRVNFDLARKWPESSRMNPGTILPAASRAATRWRPFPASASPG